MGYNKNKFYHLIIKAEMETVMKESLLRKFAKVYGEYPDVKVFFAPGRVNLIGEHIDYSGGHVLPCALTLGTYGVVRKRQDKKMRFYSMNFPEEGVKEYSIGAYKMEDEKDWTNYPRGVMWVFEKAGMKLPCGIDLLIYGDLPAGAGLSSSASLEVLMGFILKDLFGFNVTGEQLAIYGQKAENEFCGVNCGIMDQFAVSMGKKDHGIYLNTSDLSYEYIPVKMPGMKLVIANSNKKHSLNESKYNERRKECEKALEELTMAIGINNLCDLDEKTYDAYQVMIKDETRRRRARHAVYENARTRKAAEALKENDIQTFGKLMNESHRSLSEDYKVTGEEMDALVRSAWEQEGVLGSRMTGGGFGGSAISIVKEEYVDSFIQGTGEGYKKQTGLSADFYVVEIGNGPVLQ